MQPTIKLPELNAIEVRVLGSLMEKSRTTPDYYPMTINGLTAACNQKSSRKPVVQYEEEMVAEALNSLKKRGLVSTATGGSIRSIKYKHNFAIVFPVISAEVAVICLLMLRGPLTAGEINTNSARLFDFDSIEEIQEILTKLSSEEWPFLVQLPKRPGQKEARFAHLLAGEPDLTEDDYTSDGGIKSNSGLEARVAILETELAALKQAFDELMKQLT
jgi:uncharacterized protein YceH (UPF0502 family)